MLPFVAEVAGSGSACGCSGGGYRVVLYRQRRCWAGLVHWRNWNESFVCGTGSADLHCLAWPDFQACEMDRDGRRDCAGLWTGNVQIVVAADFMLWTYCLDGMDAGFDPAKTADRCVAQAFVSLRLGGVWIWLAFVVSHPSQEARRIGHPDCGSGGENKRVSHPPRIWVHISKFKGEIWDA